MIETAGRYTWIEEQRPGYIRYRGVTDGRRWAVHGTCAYRGDGHGPCQEGAVDPDVGPPEGRLDIPVTPLLECELCVDGGHLRFEELPSVPHRIVVPALSHGEPAEQALRMENLLPEVHLVAGDDFAYGRLLKRCWHDGATYCVSFAVVEHDVVPWPGALQKLWECPEPYCGYCYLLGRGQIGGALGCVRFAGDFLRANPGAADEWDRVPWYALDGHIATTMRRLGLDDYHIHEPPVGHAPVYAGD